MSTYLIAFAVTNFRYRANAADSSFPMRVFATPNAYNETEFLLGESEKAVKVLENYLQLPYALPKLDQIISIGSHSTNMSYNIKYIQTNDFSVNP